MALNLDKKSFWPQVSVRLSKETKAKLEYLCKYGGLAGKPISKTTLVTRLIEKALQPTDEASEGAIMTKASGCELHNNFDHECSVCIAYVKPIPVKDALRLIELALSDFDNCRPGNWAANGVMISDHNFIKLARATMRPLLGWLGWSLRGIDESREIHHTAANYPPLAALRDHYDAVRPGWRGSK